MWGDVITVAMSTEEGAFLRGQIQMEEKVHLGITQPVPEAPAAANPAVPMSAPEAANQVDGAAAREGEPEPGKFKRKEKGKAKG